MGKKSYMRGIVLGGGGAGREPGLGKVLWVASGHYKTRNSEKKKSRPWYRWGEIRRKEKEES